MLRYDDAYHRPLDSGFGPGVFGRVSSRVQMAFGLSPFGDRTPKDRESPTSVGHRERNPGGFGGPSGKPPEAQRITPHLGKFERLILFLTGNRNAIYDNETIQYAQASARKFTELYDTVYTMFPESDPITARVRGTYNLPSRDPLVRNRAKKVPQ
jgi:hypothetical protein